MMRQSLVILLLFSPAIGAGQSEFFLNTTRAAAQRDPQIDRDGPASLVAVWNSENHAGPGSKGDVILRRMTLDGILTGSEIIIHDAAGTGDQEKPSAASNINGDGVVTWASFTDRDSAYDIKARRFHNGVPSGSEFFVNTTMPRTQTEPDVAMDLSGRFVVAWDGWTASDDRDVYVRVYGADGLARTGEVRVNTTTAYSQAKPAVRYRPDGSFVVVWESWMQDEASPAGYGVYARLFDSLGVPLSGEIAVNTYTADYQWYADVETFADGGFTVVWCSWEQDGADGGIYMQRFNLNGTKRGAEQQVNTTTANYQWLPRIRRCPDESFVICWSSWKQDGSREGVYLQTYDASGRKVSFETPCNTTTAGFQWEPDIIGLGPGDVMAVWSNWIDPTIEYDVTGRRMMPVKPEGIVRPATLGHPAGRTTARLTVHVVDSLAMTGHGYEASFDSLPSKTAALNVRDVVTGDTVVAHFPIDRGENVFYLSPVFAGLAVEVVPEFDLDLDLQSSYTLRHTATNLTFAFNTPSAGLKKVAPIDVALIWGSTDTLTDGSYATVLDTALGTNGKREVLVPFTGWNLTDNQKMDLLVIDSPANKRWNAGERVIFLTPPAYRTTSTNTHAEVRPTPPSGSVILPGTGDTNVVLTFRPMSRADRFTFSSARSSILDVPAAGSTPGSFALMQNYPNPFNPSTTIRYTVPVISNVTLRVYNILGQEVRTLVSGLHQPGTYRVQFDARGLASGMYLYALEGGGVRVVEKMMVLK
jgi:hypothetical protein